MKPRHDGLTVEQADAVRAALPELRQLARSLARRCPRHSVKELETLAEDALIGRVHRWDPAKGKLMAFAGKRVREDVIRAAYAEAHDPCVAQGLSAMDVHEDTIQAPDTATRWAETLEEKEARALALGLDHIDAGRYGYSAARATRTPEDEYGSREAFDAMKRAVARAEPLAPQLLDLLFEHSLTWKEAAERLGVDERQAYRIAERAFAMLRVWFGKPRPPADRSSGAEPRS